MDNRKFLPFIITGIIAVIVVLYLSSEIFITIKAGERGVLYQRFQGGTNFEISYSPGFHIKAPWNDIFVYNVREQIINEKMGRNFLDFVNQYRVEEAKGMLTDENRNHLTVLSIAYDAGFNSKTAFYSAFKKQTGTSPTKYRKSPIAHS